MKKILLIIFIIIFLIVIVYKNTNIEEKKNSIKFTSWGSQTEIELLQDLIYEFEKKYNIQVEFMHIPQNYFQKLHLLFASNQAPDVLFINNHYLKMYTDANLLEDLTPFVEKKNDFYKVALDCLSDNNKIYAIPRDISNLVLYVNKDALKEAKIKYKEKISTLEELKEIAKKLTTEKRFGINFEEDSLFWIYYVGANGGNILSENTKEIEINTENSIQALNFYANLINKENIAPTKSQIGSMTTAQMFINGKLGLYLGGRWMVPKFRETINFDWDIIEFPSSSENRVFVDASGWAISKQSNKKEKALKLIFFLSSKDSIRKLSKSGLIIPAREECAIENIIEDKKNKPEHAEIFLKMLKHTKATPVNRNYGKINDILKEKLESVFSGTKSAEDVFDKKTMKKIKGLL